MTYHSIMTNSSSFISGLKWARRLADKLTDFTGVEIFPYSVFYVFYEQYLTTIHDFCLNIGISIGEYACLNSGISIGEYACLNSGISIGECVCLLYITCLVSL